MSKDKNIIHIFVSSTFNDMQDERDAIMKHVVPRLNEELSQYGRKVIPIDLRWGVDTHDIAEEESEKKVLHICFKAIIECKPYFIGLIGGRYGWIPSRERIENIVESLPEVDRQIILKEKEDLSVTEMEILLGALGHQDYIRHSVFCIRDEASYSSMDDTNLRKYLDKANISDPKRLASAHRLEKLKEKVIKACDNNEGCTLMNYSSHWDTDEERFSGIDTFVENLTKILLDDILNEIQQDQESNNSDSQNSQIIHPQDIFVERLSRDFVGREDVIEKAIEFVQDIYEGGSS